MSIDLHCPQCQKLIRAPDNAGGRRGKCPYCGASVYIPTPVDESDAIGLAPVDDSEEERIKNLRRESSEFAAAVGHGTEGGDAGGPAPVADAPSEDIDADIQAFVIAMRDSQLDDADAVTDRLKGRMAEARQRVKQMIAEEQLPDIPNVPPPVVQGFLKTLVGRLR
ncbi:MAG: hypothetical protein PVI86_10900 [Phycisphaerae bacterium]|jgi:hypothetical protein